MDGQAFGTFSTSSQDLFHANDGGGWVIVGKDDRETERIVDNFVHVPCLHPTRCMTLAAPVVAVPMTSHALCEHPCLEGHRARANEGREAYEFSRGETRGQDGFRVAKTLRRLNIQLRLGN
jgi:hypothetical protein